MLDQNSPRRDEIVTLIELSPLSNRERVEFFNDYVKILALSEVPSSVRRPERPTLEGEL